MKRAFTLIELLVVIAIIAILAAILFPVFAQAKLQAKKAASLSNNKQTILASLMYSNDADDMVVDITTWTPCIAAGQVCFGGVNGADNPWSLLIYPYTKNSAIYADPQAPASPAATGWPAGYNNIFGPMYGINSYLTQQVTFPYNPAGAALTPRNNTAITRPAETVEFTQKYSDSESVSDVWYGGWWFGAGTYLITVSADQPDCSAAGNAYYCAGGWGSANNFYGGPGGVNELNNSLQAGAWTGGGSLRGPALMVVSFCDGHAKSMAPGVLAAGTNYLGGLNGNTPPAQTAGSIVMTNMSIEHYYGLQ